MPMPDPAWKNWAISVLSWLSDGYWPERRDESSDRIRGPQRDYALQQLLAVGDASDVYLAVAEPDGWYLVKVSHVPEGFALLNNERKTLAQLRAAAGDTTYRKYLPRLVES